MTPAGRAPRRSPFADAATPFGLAHRAGAGEGVENSPTAFQHAVDLGYRYIETDVRATSDGHAMVFHDSTLDRTTDARGAIAATPLWSVQRATLANGDHPMTLVEALRRWPDVRLNVDVKCDDAVEPFLRAMEQADAWERVCAAAFSTRRLARLRAAAGPRLATSLGPAEVARLVAGLPVRSPGCAAQVPVRVGRLRIVTRSFVRRAHERGLQVHVWTVNDPVVMNQLLDLGVDALISDRLTELRDVLAARGLRP